MELKIYLTGAEKLLDNLKSIADKIDEKIFEVVRKTTIDVNATAKKSMNMGGKSGGIITHSKPGEPPFVQTGTLRSNVVYDVPSLQKGKEIIGKVGVRDIVPYARALEYGYNARNLKARPYLRPALAKHTPEFEKNIKDAVGSVK